MKVGEVKIFNKEFVHITDVDDDFVYAYKNNGIIIKTDKVWFMNNYYNTEFIYLNHIGVEKEYYINSVLKQFFKKYSPIYFSLTFNTIDIRYGEFDMHYPVTIDYLSFYNYETYRKHIFTSIEKVIESCL